MAEIPANSVTPEDMVEWNRLQADLKVLKAKEVLLRMKIYKHFFPTPDEGTNNYPLEQGWLLKGKRIISREVDLPVLQAMAAPNGPFQQNKIPVTSLIKWDPALVLKEYRTLTAEQRMVFDQCLTIKDGMPGLEIVLPARAAK